jgi:hypothetical protein
MTVHLEPRPVHAERARLYGILGDLLYQAPKTNEAHALLALLETERPPAEWVMAHMLLVRALRASLESDVSREFEELLCDPKSPLDVGACSDFLEPAIGRVLPSIQDRIRHLLHLGMEADRCAEAAFESDEREAQLAECAGNDLVAHHAGACLFDFAVRLQGSNRPFYGAVGAALREVLDRDLAALESRGVRVQRWIVLSVQQVHRPNGEVVLQSLVRCPRQLGDVVLLDHCFECGRWNGIQYGGKNCQPMILCRRDH